MDLITSINDAVNNFVWGAPMLILLVGVGILMTLRTKGVQFRHFGHVMKNTVGKIFSKQEAGEGEMTPFQALTTALGSTVGTGNIAGVTSAITLGGPGALFWLWVTALIGMCTKYSEVLLAVKYRERNAHGDWVGGPMYYIKNGLGKKWTWLSVLFCIFAALATLGIGNAVQAGNIVSSINNIIVAFNPDFTGQTVVNYVGGIILAVLVAIVLFGGVKRLGKMTEKLVPVMAALYIFTCLAVIILHITSIPAVFASIIEGAFTPKGATGGAVGSMIVVLTWGVKRGIFSNEAGLGSAPMAHANSSETNPVKQGMYGIFEVFMITIVLCTITGLTLLTSGIDMNYGVNGDTGMNAAALATVFGTKGGAIIIGICIILFAFSTIPGWTMYGVRCCEYLFGIKAIKPYQVLSIVVSFVGCTMSLDLAWAIADTLNGLMAIPNLIAVIALSGVVVRTTKEYFDSLPSKKDKKAAVPSNTVENEV